MQFESIIIALVTVIAITVVVVKYRTAGQKDSKLKFGKRDYFFFIKFGIYVSIALALLMMIYYML